jgi:hypothetical protein
MKTLSVVPRQHLRGGACSVVQRRRLRGGACCTISMLLFVVASGCSFHARDADSYRKATRALLETRNPDIKTCYDSELKKDPKVAGVVVVKFTVQKETGAISAAKVDSASTAPATLADCVVKALDGLALDPPDERQGDATFQWEFQVKS